MKAWPTVAVHLNMTHELRFAAFSTLFLLAVVSPCGLESGVDDTERFVWDLSSLYPNEAAWTAERTAILEKVESIGRRNENGTPTAEALADVLDEVSDLRSRAAKMAVYGVLVSSVDTHSVAARRQYDVGAQLEAQVEGAVAFLPTEIQGVPQGRLLKWLNEEPRLARHRARIMRVLREAPHTLPAEQQAIVKTMAEWPRLAGDVFWAIHGSDIGWPTLKKEDGGELSLNIHSYRPLEGVERSRASDLFLKRLRSLQGVFGLLYARRIEADLTVARLRGFQNGVDALWFLNDGMPEQSHRTMIQVTRDSLPVLRRYVALRGRALGLERMGYADLYTPPGGIRRGFSVGDALNIAEEASAPLGTAYQARLRERLRAKWMHLPAWPQKQGSLEVYPPIGGANPYLIMSYRPGFRSSQYLAGGITLMMAFADVPRDRVPDTRDDPGIYTNAVLHAGCLLHDDYLEARSTDRSEHIAYLIHALDLLWTRYFRWVLVAELDAWVEQRVGAGKTPSGPEISDMYLRLLREYYGQKEGVVAEDDIYAAEWMTFPIQFFSYEHQAWPPAMAAAVQIAEGLRAHADAARRAVDEALYRGGSDRSYLMLKEVGIDLASSKPYEEVIHRMTRQLDGLETLLADGR
ncbi:MAG TPA: hypothetical protein VKI41_01650 [Vicinamibacteria bacterium]|nr:hypothetical protein [Vicinamibacteria bacterium]